ncbi:hypothetical protein KAW64_10075, partial [bacterium]|nr:hypothetical protein [bacterium]
TNEVRRERFEVVGRPSLSRIRRLTIGVRNDVAGDPDITGEIWLDDIRLSDVRDDIGLAERITIDAKFADFLDLDFDLRHVDGEFHSLKQKYGSGRDNITYNVTGTMNADRFVSVLGISTPVNVTWKRSVSRPKFSSGSDVVLGEQDSEDQKTETFDRSIAVSLSRKRQSPDFWTHLLVDGLSLRASMGEHQKLSPTKADTSTTLRGRVSYRYAPKKQGIRLFGNTELFLKPSSIRLNADAHDIHMLNYDIAAAAGDSADSQVQTKRSDKYDRKLNADASIDFQFLDNLRTSHSVSVKRDLLPIKRVIANLNTGVETERRYSNSLSFNPKFGRWFAPQYSFSSSFTDDHGLQVRREGDAFAIRNVRGQNSHDVRASFDIKKLLGSPASTRKRSPRDRRESGSGDGREKKRDEGDARDRAGGEEGEGEERTGISAAGEDGEDVGARGSREDEDGGRASGATEVEPEGPGFQDLVRPVVTLLRNTDAVDARYSIKRSSRYDRITWSQLPDWMYRLGLSSGAGADDRTEEHTLSLSSGLKLTSQ